MWRGGELPIPAWSAGARHVVGGFNPAARGLRLLGMGVGGWAGQKERLRQAWEEGHSGEAAWRRRQPWKDRGLRVWKGLGRYRCGD